MDAQRDARGLDRRHAADRCPGTVDWRYAWIALPFVAAGAAGLAAAAGPRSENRQAPCGSLLSAFELPSTRRWLAGELLAGSAWTGTLVYSGALFSESYGISSTATGVALALVAVAFVGGTRSSRASSARTHASC